MIQYFWGDIVSVPLLQGAKVDAFVIRQENQELTVSIADDAPNRVVNVVDATLIIRREDRLMLALKSSNS